MAGPPKSSRRDHVFVIVTPDPCRMKKIVEPLGSSNQLRSKIFIPLTISRRTNGTSSVVGLMRYCFVLLDNKLGAIHSGDYGPGKSIRRDCGHGNPFGKLWSQGQSSFIQWARYIR
ncbi:unnamed protein product [Lactuca virosa]|uniref:Uncharacterized protein n=1 Tax=Lactuca virosa TaxID=75947 RepID=A0AAU9LV92_9ASTR|nr:unnamed protein product [Lactuca virosa]